MLIINYQENTNHTTNELSSHICYKGYIKKTTNKCWWRYGEKGILVHYWWKCKLAQPIILKIELLYYPAIPLLRIYLKKMKALVWKDTWAATFTSSVQSLSCVWLFATPWTAACQASLSITNSQNLLKLISIESVMPTNRLILCRLLLLLPSIFPSIKVFSNESVLCIRWSMYCSFSISPSNIHWKSELISFRIAWFDLLAVQGTLKNLPQNHCSEASVLQLSAFFMIQLSHPSWLLGKP